MKRVKKGLIGLCAMALAFTIWFGNLCLPEVSAFGADRGRTWEFSEEELAWIEEARTELKEILKERTVIALVYLSDSLPVREAADENSDAVCEVPSGQQVQILDVCLTEDYRAWEYVKFSRGGTEYTGYIPREHLACSDEVFLEWEDFYGMNPSSRALMSLGGDTRSAYADVEQFPESYRSALKALKEAHPNWTFVKMNTNLDWNTVVKNEMVRGRNLIPTSFSEAMWDSQHSPGWGYITEDALKYYLDPRNGLTEELIFQFELLTYNESYHTESAVQTFLNQTFMSGIIPNLELTYAKTFFAVGKELNVSPFHLACRVYQEQGNGTSPLISGNYEGAGGIYKGYYNYFNIGASGKTDEEVILSGLKRAKEENWYNGYYSILGGAKEIAKNYILHCQDTLYLQKFDVDSSYDGLYWHQYMQNVCAPSSEGKNIRKLYNQAGSLDNTFVFKIPVYNNMPEKACENPDVSYTMVMKKPEGYKKAEVYIDGVLKETKEIDGYLYTELTDGEAATAVMYQYNENNIPVGMKVWELSHNGKRYDVKELSGLTDLLSYHGFSVRITGKSGIRFKTGVSAETRAQLLSDAGIDGYRLKEYGTLVMINDNREQYPMVMGGQKVLSGRSYGINEKGEPEDKIYETVNGRYRYTSVLVGLPVNQYQTDYAFRGYAVLTKGEKEVTVYGPVMWRSIYTLAQQVLAAGQYKEGSDADVFLRKLIKDADEYKAVTVSGGDAG